MRNTPCIFQSIVDTYACAAQHRMYATLLAQPPTWARFTLVRVCRQPFRSPRLPAARVMSPLGGPHEESPFRLVEGSTTKTHVLDFHPPLC
jgi:hypothetical protein